MLTLAGITVRRGERDVLRDICLNIPSGRLTVVVGPSGAGKTTLIHVLNGLIGVAAGALVATELGRLDKPGALKSHRSRTATIFQDHALIDRLSALDNVLLGLADQRNALSVLPWSKAFRHRAADALDEVGLLHRAHARLGRLSGGERQRVGVARALVRRPTLLLGDEPFCSVDPALAEHLSRELRQAVTRSGVTACIVLHQLDIALRLADWIIGLADGRVAFSGPPAEFDAPAQARVFFSEPAAARHEKRLKEYAPCLVA
jgi:phosphonate transport system ATP-binding protein